MDETTQAQGKVFVWPRLPQSEDEFEAMMRAIDAHLSQEGLSPFQRPLHVPRLLWDAFKWEGNIIPPKELAELPGYRDQVLMAKAHRWYEQVYGDKLKGEFAIGYAPYRLGGAAWRVRFPVIYGRCEFFLDINLSNRGVALKTGGRPSSYNVLTSVEGLPQGFAQRLTSNELQDFWGFYLSTYEALSWREVHLVGHDFFEEARHDYAASVDDVLHRRYAQSRWASAQAIEKVLKAILQLTNVPYSTRGAAGHDLLDLAEKLERAHGISLNRNIVSLAHCSPAVRYGEESSSENQALSANHAVVGVVEMLSTHPHTEQILVAARQCACTKRKGDK